MNSGFGGLIRGRHGALCCVNSNSDGWMEGATTKRAMSTLPRFQALQGVRERFALLGSAGIFAVLKALRRVDSCRPTMEMV